MSRANLLSGIQPTGRMHLGNWLGAVSNWVKLQDQYRSFLFIADYHSLTTVYENPGQLAHSKQELALDILACGVDPKKATLFFQSDVPAHAELHLMLSMVTPIPWLERVPTYKDKILEVKDKDLNTYGFLGYPVLQAADILLYMPDVVPVGKDQLPHLELTREIVRRFNHLYQTEVFKEPADMLTEFPVLPGVDGRKMSKSYGNAIPVSATPDEIKVQLKTMVTDPARIRRTDPGTPEKCPVYAYHQIFSPVDRVAFVADGCRTAGIGCIQCKMECADHLIEALAPIHERRKTFQNDLAQVDRIMDEGAETAREVAGETLGRAKKAMGLKRKV
ncbi:tryptophan--tRNA ligase [bacterium]|nr:tryptophan--tRNA ligase [bacterium]